MTINDFLPRMLNFNHTVFENAFDVSVQFQDQIEKIGTTMMDQAGWLPAENRKRYDDWVDGCKASRANYKTFIDEGYRNAEIALNSTVGMK